MSRNSVAAERGKRREQRLDQRRKPLVLRIRVRLVVRSLELDADRKIIAVRTPLILRRARVPGAPDEWDVLYDLTRAADQRVRRDAQCGDLAEIRMRVVRQAAGEQPVDPRAAVFPRGQADPVYDDEVDRGAARPLIAMW